MIEFNSEEVQWGGNPLSNKEHKMNDTLVVEEVNEFYRPMKLADRCDRCGETSQAFARAVKVIDNKEVDIQFCGHHFAENEPALVANGWWIQDERHLINKQPMSGAPEGAIDVDDDY